MGKWITELKTVQINENLHELTEPLIYISSKIGMVIVDAGTRTDFASVPRIPIAYLIAGGRTNAAATLHDSLYGKHNTGRCKEVTRLQSDNLIFEATLDSLPSEGYSLKSILMRPAAYFLGGVQWVFVRLFGGSHW